MKPDHSEGEDSASVSESVYAQLKDDIVTGRFEPAGRLRFDALRERYGSSISPLREALSRLTTEGLVITETNRGARVTPIDEADFRDLSNVRKLVEGEALRLSIEHGDAQWEADVVSAMHLLKKAAQDPLSKNQPSQSRIDSNRAFHVALVSRCPSARLLWMRDLLYAQAERYIMLSFRSAPLPSGELVSEHEAIMSAALKRRSNLAVALIEAHIDTATERVMPLIQQLSKSS